MRDETDKVCDTPTNQCSRELTSRELLLRLIEDKERELADLRALAQAMPNEMTYQAERALRSLLLTRRIA